jgi:uncharacterized repeat protein (TIGR03803 family)
MPHRSKIALILPLLALASPAHAAAASGLTLLTSFAGGLGGAYPAAGLVSDIKGNLYGVTTQGGTCTNQGVTCGIVFRLAPPAPGKTAWTQTTLLDFKGTKGGATPEGTLLIDSTGTLYGTAYQGGKNGSGLVFTLTPPATGKTKWTETVLHNFGGSGDGTYPYGGLTADADRNLYGTTSGGGSAGLGVVFELVKPAAGGTWKEKLLHDFAGGTDGGNPFLGSLAIDAKGALYGTTRTGGSFGYGTVFKLTPPKTTKGDWTETILHAFAANADGATPKGGVVLDNAGNVYGTTYAGTPNGWGSVFELTPPASATGTWTETQIQVFAGGAACGNPTAALTPIAGGFAGTTSNCVYELTQAGGAWSFTVLHNFTGNPDGNVAEAALIQDSAGNFYGTTYSGGVNYGTVFEFVP